MGPALLLQLGIGGCTGRRVNKCAQFSLPVCAPGWFDLPADISKAVLEMQPPCQPSSGEATADTAQRRQCSDAAVLSAPIATDATTACTFTSHDSAASASAGSGGLAIEASDSALAQSTESLSVSVSSSAHSSLVDAVAATSTSVGARAGSPCVDIALSCCVAHLVCEIERVEEVKGHFLLTCQITRAFVLKSYWSGKQFVPQPRSGPTCTCVHVCPDHATADGHAVTRPMNAESTGDPCGGTVSYYPPYLSFFGSHELGYVVPRSLVSVASRSAGCEQAHVQSIL